MTISINRSLTTLALLCAVSTNASAEESKIERDYSISTMLDRIRDRACVWAFTSEIAPRLVDLNSLKLSFPTWMQTTNGHLMIFDDVEFVLSETSISGSITCVFAEGARITDVAAIYRGPGMKALRFHPDQIKLLEGSSPPLPQEVVPSAGFHGATVTSPQ